MVETKKPKPSLRAASHRIMLLGLPLVACLCLLGCGVGGGRPGVGGLDFSLSVSPGSQNVTAGNLITYTITVNQTAGLGGTVQLSVSGVPVGATATFDPPAVTVQGTSKLNILTATNTPVGTSQLTITGSDLTGTQTTSLMMTVNPGPPPIDFVMTVTPATQTTLAGGSVAYTVSTTSDSSSPIQLSVSGLPQGATLTFNPPSIPGTGSSQLTVSAANPTAAGFYGLNVSGSDSTGTQKVPVILDISAVDFTLAQQVGPAGVTAGGNIVGTVTASPILGALPPVTLSVTSGLPAGASASFAPNTLSGATTSATMTISTSTTLALGNYQLTVQGQDASGSQIVQIPVTVVSGNPSAGFFISSVPNTLEVQAGATATYTILISNNAGPVPSVTLSVDGMPLNSSATSVPGGPNVFQVIVSTDPLSPGTVSDITITATGPGGSQQIDVFLQVDASN